MREHSVAKIPVIAVVGEKEVANRSINLRRLGHKDTNTVSLDDAVKELSKEALPPDIIPKN